MVKLKQNTAAKVTAFVLLLVSLTAAALSVLGVGYAIGNDYYTRSGDKIMEDLFQDISYEISFGIFDRLEERVEDDGSTSYRVYGYSGTEKDFYYTVADADSGEILINDPPPFDSSYRYETEETFSRDTVIMIDGEKVSYIPKSLSIHVYLKPAFHEYSSYYYREQLTGWLYQNRFSVLINMAVFLILTVVLYVFLLSSAGHKKEKEEIESGLLERIPFDLFTGIIVALIALLLALISEFASVRFPINFIFVAALLLICAVLFVIWSVSFAIRYKQKSVIKNTVIYRLIRFLYRSFRRIGSFLILLLHNLPILWKTILAIAALSCLEFLGIVLFIIDTPELLLVLWIFEKVLLIPVILLVVMNLKKLQTGGQRLAEGDLSHHINTNQMFWDFKKHAENLNCVGLGMSKAVDERMKSERFKTELITNVSHDIKTPLTSIINYIDLLKKEQPEGEKVNEYLEVLDRQSGRLKKLIEDLVEASKASSGSLSVSLNPCYVSIILTQAVGEYQEKLKQLGLELIVKQPEQAIQIMADGRHLWRIFDNLLNNICKHALSGSRVYLTLEQLQNTAVITFKNISKYELDISSEELMERFVRGDKSRNTEGSGLGLSIAKSLTELQRGSFDIEIDGDLFKAVLTFQTISES